MTMIRRAAWWAWRQCHSGCVLCQPRIGTYPVASLCSAHRAVQMRALAEVQAIHPDGHCTDTCGCMTLEEFEASLR